MYLIIDVFPPRACVFSSFFVTWQQPGFAAPLVASRFLQPAFLCNRATAAEEFWRLAVVETLPTFDPNRHLYFQRWESPLWTMIFVRCLDKRNNKY